MKTCFKCKKQKMNADFFRNKRSKDGLATYCRECEKLRQKDRTFSGNKPERKTCFRCKKDKPASEFFNNKAREDGLSSSCKDCQKLFRKHPPPVLGVRKPRRVVREETSRQAMIVKYGLAVVEAMESITGAE